jgi:hypothetical protein
MLSNRNLTDAVDKSFCIPESQIFRAVGAAVV